MTLVIDTTPSQLQTELERNCGVNLDGCLQCGCCTAGCSSIEFMDYGPRQVIQLVKLGYREVILGSSAIWMCVACHICEDRCPAGISIPTLMDGLREIAFNEASLSTTKPAQFHRLFLEQVRRFGRQHEGLLALRYSWRTSNPLPNPRLIWRLLTKGRVDLKPLRLPGRSYRRMVEKLKDEGGARHD
ncbi:MAG: heterodisulfide reductase subunit C [Firmicutes bacterium]|nr:heterodisulfide reductase subunit C [Bacillota bacterium]